MLQRQQKWAAWRRSRLSRTGPWPWAHSGSGGTWTTPCSRGRRHPPLRSPGPPLHRAPSAGEAVVANLILYIKSYLFQAYFNKRFIVPSIVPLRSINALTLGLSL